MKLFNCILLALSVVMMTSCDSETPSGVLPATDIAVMRGVTDGVTTFAVNRAGSDQSQVLDFAGVIDTLVVKPGDALLIRYNGVLPDGTIDLVSYSHFTNLRARIVDSDSVGAWNATPVFLQSYTVVDNSVILRMKLPASGGKRRLGIVVDRSTISNSVPTAYLVHELSDPEPTFDRSYYVGFNMSDIVSETGVTSFNLFVNNTNLPINQIKINLNKN